MRRMMPSWTRRDALRTLVSAAAVPPAFAAGAPRRRVGVIGGGMAGVSLAWLLDGERDVILLEARDAIGGNVQSVDITLDGHQVVVDMGAQYFHPGPYPVYTALLNYLGIYPPASSVPEQSHSFPASISLGEISEPAPRFISPVFPTRIWPVLAPWNFSGLIAFAVAFTAARERELRRESWTLTLEEWLPTLGLAREQWEGMILPWAASLFSGSIEQARTLSARGAMIFAARALPQNPFDPILYYVLNRGMAEALRRMTAQSSTLQVITSAPVRQISRHPGGGFRIHAKGGTIAVDDLVLASSGPGTLRLLSSIPGTELQQAALRGIAFHDARLALHTDPAYVPAQEYLWSFLNCRIQGAYCEASMWLAPVITDVPPATATRLWKSWVTHRDRQPAHVLHATEFKHMLPTAATIRAQREVRSLQGRDGIWMAGGYLHPYDSQETALRSAIRVARGLGVTSRLQMLLDRAQGG